MIGLQKIVETNSQFLNDLGNIKGRERPLFFKEIFSIEPQNTFKYNRISKINPREESEEEYTIINEIRQWIDKTYHIPFSQSAYQAIFWKLTIPTLFDRKYNVTIYPQGDKYTILTFGTKNIIEDLLDKQKKEKDCRPGRKQQRNDPVKPEQPYRIIQEIRFTETANDGYQILINRSLLGEMVGRRPRV